MIEKMKIGIVVLLSILLVFTNFLSWSGIFDCFRVSIKWIIIVFDIVALSIAFYIVTYKLSL